MPRITTNQIALGVGLSGAMVDVSSYVSLGQGVTYDWGRQDEFRDVTPTVTAFTLDNADGRFTPGNLSPQVRTNLVTNPSFETALTGVAAISSATVTLDATTAQSGSQSVKVVTPGSVSLEGVQISTVTPMSPGLLYSAGIWVKVPAAQSMVMQFRFNSGVAVISTNFTGTGAWQLVTANSLSLGVTITSTQINIRTSNTAAVTFWVDAAIIEQAPVIGTFFDGASTDSNFAYAWTGTANASTSTQSVPVWALTEGMPVSWLLGTRLVASSVLSIAPAFPADQPAWAQIIVACDDMLGNAARKNLTSLADDINVAAGQLAFWSMDGDANTVYAQERTGSGLGPLNLQTAIPPNANPVLLAGMPPVPGVPGAQMRLQGDTELNYLASTVNRTTTIPYSQSSMGFWGFWVTPVAATQGVFTLSCSGLSGNISVTVTGTTAFLSPGAAAVVTYTPASLTAWRQPHFLSFGATTTFAAGAWTLTYTFYMDGVSVGSRVYTQVSGPVSSLTNADRQPIAVRFSAGDGVNNGVVLTVSRLSHTSSIAHEELAVGTTESSRLQAVDAVVPEMVLDTLPSDLGQQQIGFESGSVQAVGFGTASGAVLDSINDLMRTEQGYVWTAATGSLLAPVQKVKVRARNRPTTITASFDVARELSGAPNFVRDVTNMISSIGVQGSDSTITVTDPTIPARAGSSSNSETVLDFWPFDLTAFGQDRLIRGKNVNLRIASVVVDAMNTPTDRSADLLGLKPGDRVQFTNLPLTQLGFTTWDGWLIGGKETHSLTEHSFQLFFAPVISTPIPVFDTDRFSAGGVMSLTSSITSGATSMSVTSSTADRMYTTGPYTLQIDQEQVTATAITAANPAVITITRGVNSTVAAAHSAGALVDVAVVPRFAY